MSSTYRGATPTNGTSVNSLWNLSVYNPTIKPIMEYPSLAACVRALWACLPTNMRRAAVEVEVALQRQWLQAGLGSGVCLRKECPTLDLQPCSPNIRSESC